MYELKDYLNSINFTKQRFDEGDGDVFWEKKYVRLLLIVVCLTVSLHYQTK